MDRPRATLGQMRQCLDALVHLDAPRRLQQAKALRQSEADMVARGLRDARDLLLKLEPHAAELRAMLGRSE